MPDTKITALTALTAADPANDVLPIVDVSDTTMAASGTTKKISINNVLGCSGTATLASATISGDLNVSGNGAFTGTGYAALQRALIPVGENGVTSLDFRWYSSGTTYTTGARVHSSSDAAWTASSTPARLMFSTVPSGSTALSERYRIDNAGIHTWQNVGGVAGTAMTLNATGLGVGVAPSAWDAGLSPIELKSGSVVGFAGSVANYTSNAFYQAAWKYKTTAAAAYYQQANGSHVWNIAPSGTAGNAITWTQAMTLDASGNLILLSSNTPATLTTNGQLTVNATSNTNLRFSYRGSDGVTRVANITLA